MCVCIYVYDIEYQKIFISKAIPTDKVKIEVVKKIGSNIWEIQNGICFLLRIMTETEFFWASKKLLEDQRKSRKIKISSQKANF
jgi:hypothetical protein